MERNKAISRRRLVRHSHEGNPLVSGSTRMSLFPKLCHTFDARAAVCRNANRGSERAIAISFGSLLDPV